VILEQAVPSEKITPTIQSGGHFNDSTQATASPARRDHFFTMDMQHTPGEELQTQITNLLNQPGAVVDLVKKNIVRLRLLCLKH